MYNRLAVIDLGTNTFHLLIVELNGNGGGLFTELYRERRFVQLAEDGINRIGKGAFQRGLSTISDFKAILDQFQIKKVKAFGTAALRTAVNATDFIKEVRLNTGIIVERISGGEEARLICQGVRMALPIREEPVLIMDIGGGSVEFILADEDEMYWAQSFPIGVAVLNQQFHKSEPISEKELAETYNHLAEQLAPLVKALRKMPVNILAGASGTFDVLEEMLADKKNTPLWSHVPAHRFYPVYDHLIGCDLLQRLNTRGIPEPRAKLIVVAMILIKYVLQIGNIENIWISTYAMKEGILQEMMESVI